MEFEELTSLINIRNYVINSIALPTIDRKTVNELNGMLLLLDKKIIGIITGDEFKEYIGYKSVQEAKEAAARITNIYSGIENKNTSLHNDIKNHKLR
jgi:hypothetical protein